MKKIALIALLLVNVSSFAHEEKASSCLAQEKMANISSDLLFKIADIGIGKCEIVEYTDDDDNIEEIRIKYGDKNWTEYIYTVSINETQNSDQIKMKAVRQFRHLLQNCACQTDI